MQIAIYITEGKGLYYNVNFTGNDGKNNGVCCIHMTS